MKNSRFKITENTLRISQLTYRSVLDFDELELADDRNGGHLGFKESEPHANTLPGASSEHHLLDQGRDFVLVLLKSETGEELKGLMTMVK